jgi:transcriptional regulator with XRE-family HTH domain
MGRDRADGAAGDGGGDAAHHVREEIARRRLSRKQLAELAQVSLSTLEKGLSGRRPFTLPTLVRLETVLGVPLRSAAPTWGLANCFASPPSEGTAPDELGNYTRASVTWLEGSYLTLRPSFGETGAVYAYRTDISWHDADRRLVFREGERVDRDFTQFGVVAVPLQSGHIYLVTNRHGQHRLVVVARPTITGEMHGLLTTLQAGRGAHLSPVATPIVLRPIAPGTAPAFGRIARGHAAFAEYRALLRRTLADHFAALLAD